MNVLNVSKCVLNNDLNGTLYLVWILPQQGKNVAFCLSPLLKVNFLFPIDETWIGIYTAKDCYPVQETFIKNYSVVLSTRFFDVQLGIKDPSVFTPPSTCQTAQPEKMSEDCTWWACECRSDCLKHQLETDWRLVGMRIYTGDKDSFRMLNTDVNFSLYVTLLSYVYRRKSNGEHVAIWDDHFSYC